MATIIRMQLRDPSYERDGALFLSEDLVGWVPVELVVDGSCTHETTLCHDCAWQWGTDWRSHPDDLAALERGEL